MFNFNHDINSSLEVLHNGGLILYPTDTIWGIGCDATNPTAVQKVYELKKRNASNALIVLVADERDVLRHVAAVDLGLFNFLDQQPKPTTVIYEGALGLADNLPAGDGSVAIRICRDEFCRNLLKRFRKPVVSTSANLSGEPAPGNFGEISPAIINGVDYAVCHRREERGEAVSSAIVRWKNGQVEVIRP